MSEPMTSDFELDLDERLTAAAELLSTRDDRHSHVTRPYELPVDELFGDLTRTSAQFTVPVTFDELPDDAYPTEVHFVAIDP